MTIRLDSRVLLALLVLALGLFLIGAARSEFGQYEIETEAGIANSGPFVFRLDRFAGEICLWRAGGEFPGNVQLRFLGCTQGEDVKPQ